MKIRGRGVFACAPVSFYSGLQNFLLWERDMKYKKVISGIFLSRPNRFIAKVSVDGEEETAHVKNTGRCRELLLPGTEVFLYDSYAGSEKGASARKTRYDLIAVRKERDGKSPLLINMDSQVPNDAVEEWIRSGNGRTFFGAGASIRREVKYGASRFDFHIESGERKIFLEVKGCTLEENGVVMFPDAPTERGVKHVRELIESVREGYEAYLLFVIQMKGINSFHPNDRTDPAFGAALRLAYASGVRVVAVDCLVEPDSIILSEQIPVIL